MTDTGEDRALFEFYEQMEEHVRQTPPSAIVEVGDIIPLVNCYRAALDGDMEEAERWAAHPVCQEWLQKQGGG